MADDLREDEFVLIIHEIMHAYVRFVSMVLLYLLNRRCRRAIRPSSSNKRSYSLIARIPRQVEHLHEVVSLDPGACIDYLRMSAHAFAQLCHLLEHSGGLKQNRNISVPEQVAMFLVILAHHEKNRIVKREYRRSGRTVSKYFHRVLNAVIKLHKHLLAQPEPIQDDSTDDRWRYFKGCLGALDGTYIPIRVNKSDRARYRNRKGVISVNMLGACDTRMNFVYILTGWEGSAADSRVLRDAVTRPNRLKIPEGCYYLCDNGYMNCPGFLTPYRGTRYHLDDWGRGRAVPQTPAEYFNMRHCRARNVIERAFGLLKMRWAILRSPSFYPVRVHNRIIMACCLLHNYIRMYMPSDPLEDEIDNIGRIEDDDNASLLQSVEASNEWTGWRDELAVSIFNEWRS